MILKFGKGSLPAAGEIFFWNFTMLSTFLLWFSAFLTLFPLSFWAPAAPRSPKFARTVRISENRPRTVRSGYHPPPTPGEGALDQRLSLSQNPYGPSALCLLCTHRPPSVLKLMTWSVTIQLMRELQRVSRIKSSYWSNDSKVPIATSNNIRTIRVRFM